MIQGLRHLQLLVLGGLAAACGTTATLTPQPVAIAPDVAAYLCADVCRAVFPNADPVPYHAGAPATMVEPGRFEIRYERRSDGRWTPRATGRLLAAFDGDPDAPVLVCFHPSDALSGFVSPDASVVVSIEPGPAGVLVETRTRGADIATLVDHLTAALRLLTDLEGDATDTEPCCARHAPLQARALARRAARLQNAGDLLAARDAARAACAVNPRMPGIHLWIGTLDRALGQDELAGHRLSAASRLARDGAERTFAARAAQASKLRQRTNDQGVTLREDALARLEQGDLTSAAALAHEARARAPEPIADLQLRHELLRARGDHFGALGTALLLREYGGGPGVDRLLAHDFGVLGQHYLATRAEARRWLRDLPAAAMIERLQLAGARLAARAWIRVAEGASALAAPPK